jgi:periplasmic protein CpxP/Spy
MHGKRTILLVALMVSGVAAAADQPAPNRSGWTRADFEQMRAKRRTEREEDMAILLGLSANQRPALTHFLQSAEPEPPGDERRDGGAATRPTNDTSMSARLDAMQAAADRHEVMIKERIAATRQFYASLTPDQQHRFDAFERLREGRRHGSGDTGRFHRFETAPLSSGPG